MFKILTRIFGNKIQKQETPKVELSELELLESKLIFAVGVLTECRGYTNTKLDKFMLSVRFNSCIICYDVSFESKPKYSMVLMIIDNKVNFKSDVYNTVEMLNKLTCVVQRMIDEHDNKVKKQKEYETLILNNILSYNCEVDNV